jgi:LuxR family transcriptional regulator, maltose regulon positive regulatory protein
LPTPNFPELIPRMQMLLLRLDLDQGDDVRESVKQLLDQALSQGRQALVSELWLLYAEACTAAGDKAAADQAREAGQVLRRRLGYQCLWFTVAKPANEVAVAAPQSSAANTLSQRELAVLRLIAQGCSNQEVAEQLFISLHTVKTHARRINGKLGVSRRTQAVAKAKALGFF